MCTHFPVEGSALRKEFHVNGTPKVDELEHRRALGEHLVYSLRMGVDAGGPLHHEVVWLDVRMDHVAGVKALQDVHQFYHQVHGEVVRYILASVLVSVNANQSN